ncbi:hypothetical protein B0A80_17745 [Flavobacterium tructae]|uniref:methionyl-tRNA formyltransferase n=1 Tax=Flavobacterium tructae TaxID=1114873 RepID=UPI000B5B64FA|nr:formyltransferase family protein [Flavobacterium tructae]OXB20771.1 hypothetical protein B0A80_17745 [Flavobacterium tructae]
MSSICNIGLFLMGKKGFKSLDFILEKKGSFDIKYVVCSRDNSILEDYFKDIYDLCSRNNIKFFERSFFEDDSNVDIIFAVGWRWLMHENLNKIIVFHDALLPKYRGFNPLVTALIEGDTEIGVTALIANEKMDSGDIVGQEIIEIKYPIKIEKAIDYVSELYSVLMYKIIINYINKDLSRRVQDENEATYSLWRNNDDYRINWSESSSRIERFVNAVGFPYNFASAIYDGKEIKILEVTETQDLKIINRVPGKIFQILENKPLVICGEGILKIEKAIYLDSREEVRFNLLRVKML